MWNVHVPIGFVKLSQFFLFPALERQGHPWQKFCNIESYFESYAVESCKTSVKLKNFNFIYWSLNNMYYFYSVDLACLRPFDTFSNGFKTFNLLIFTNFVILLLQTCLWHVHFMLSQSRKWFLISPNVFFTLVLRSNLKNYVI